MDLEPEQPLQDMLFAPPESVLVLASASGVVSLGPLAHEPEFRTQFTSLFWDLLGFWDKLGRGELRELLLCLRG